MLYFLLLLPVVLLFIRAFAKDEPSGLIDVYAAMVLLAVGVVAIKTDTRLEALEGEVLAVTTAQLSLASPIEISDEMMAQFKDFEAISNQKGQ